MRGDTFHSLYFLDQILSAEFLSKIFTLFLEVKIDIELNYDSNSAQIFWEANDRQPIIHTYLTYSTGHC